MDKITTDQLFGRHRAGAGESPEIPPRAGQDASGTRGAPVRSLETLRFHPRPPVAVGALVWMIYLYRPRVRRFCCAGKPSTET